jgi:hypothetical protein
MGSGAMIFIPSYLNFGSGIRKLTGRKGFIDRQLGDLISLLLLFLIREEG